LVKVLHLFLRNFILAKEEYFKEKESSEEAQKRW
jgi:hypothetical protein